MISESLIRNKLLDMYRAKYIEQDRNEEDEILRLIANLPEEQQSQLIEKLASQQKNL